MSRPLHVALLTGEAAPQAAALAEALRSAGQLPVLMVRDPTGAYADTESIRLRSLPDKPLRSRRIGDGLAHLPHAFVALARGKFDLAHAFSPADALPAVAWARRSRRPAVLTFVAPLERETIANRRLRLATLKRAVYGADVVLATSHDVQKSLRRMLALDAPVLASSDAAGHLSLYRELAAGLDALSSDIMGRADT